MTFAEGATDQPRTLLRLSGFGVPLTTETVILTAVMTLTFLLFLLIEPTPRWLALLGALIAALATDGILRHVRSEIFEAGADSTPYLFLPTLLALTVPVFAEYNVRGYWDILVAAGGGLVFGLVVLAEITSVRPTDPLHTVARFVAAAATYFVVFALLALGYAFDLGLRESIAAIALISMLCAVELLRDDQLDPIETLVFSCITGLVVAEARWVMQYLPIDGYLAALALLLVFYFSTGVVPAYITRQLHLVVTGESAAVAAAGIALVAAARIAGLA